MALTNFLTSVNISNEAQLSSDSKLTSTNEGKCAIHLTSYEWFLAPSTNLQIS